MPSYRRTIANPIWAVYEYQKLIATTRAKDREEAMDKLKDYKGKNRRLKKIGEW